MDLSIVIVSYNTTALLLATLAAIYRHPPEMSYEVVVADSASTEDVLGAVRAAFPQVITIPNTENVGFARGCNQGIRATSGRHVLFLNPDTEVQPGALTGLMRYADSRPDASAYTCRLLNPDGTLQVSCFHFPNLRMAFYGFFPLVPTDSVANGRYPRETFERVFHPEHIMGACLMVKRDVLDEIGLWDEHYFMYFEETDLCYRLEHSGHLALYTPDYAVMHRGAQSTTSTIEIREKMSVAFYRSQAYFYRKHYGLCKLVVLKAIIALGLLYWTTRSLRSYLRKRIDLNLLRMRLTGYRKILFA